MKAILTAKEFIKKIAHLAKVAEKKLAQSKNEAAIVCLKAQRIADEFTYNQVFNSKMEGNGFDVYSELVRQFSQVYAGVKNSKKDELKENRELLLVFEMLTDGQYVVSSADPNLLNLAENLIESVNRETSSTKRRFKLRRKSDQFFLLYTIIYNNLREKIHTENLKTNRESISDFRFYNNHFSISDISSLITFLKGHRFFKICFDNIKIRKNKRKLSHDDLLFGSPGLSFALKTNIKQFKKDVFEISNIINPEAGELTRHYFKNWFHQFKYNGRTEADTTLIYGHVPHINSYEIKDIHGGIYAAHEVGHAIFHQFSIDHRKYGEHITNIFLDEICSQVFEMLYIFRKLDQAPDQETHDRILYDYLIPGVFSMVLESSVLSEFSIKLLNGIHLTDSSEEIGGLYLDSLNDHYKNITQTSDTKYDWCVSRALYSPLYEIGYLTSCPIAFNIALDIHNGGKWGLKSVNYLLQNKSKVTVQGLLKTLKYKNCKENYEQMFSCLTKKIQG